MLSKTKGNKIMQAKIRCLFSVISTDLFMNQFDFFAFRVELFSFVSKWQLETKKECLTITKIKENDQNTRKLCLDIFNSTWLIMSAPFNKDLLSATVWKKEKFTFTWKYFRENNLHSFDHCVCTYVDFT